jgi:hypothetical protein
MPWYLLAEKYSAVSKYICMFSLCIRLISDQTPLSRDFLLKIGQDMSALLFTKNSQSGSPSLVVFGKLKFQITNQQITILTRFSGL